MNKGLIIALIAAALGIWWWQSQGRLQTEESMMMEEVGASPAAGVIDEEGNVDTEMFEESQMVGDESTLESIGAEIEGTVILEEDFGDL